MYVCSIKASLSWGKTVTQVFIKAMRTGLLHPSVPVPLSYLSINLVQGLILSWKLAMKADSYTAALPFPIDTYSLNDGKRTDYYRLLTDLEMSHTVPNWPVCVLSDVCSFNKEAVLSLTHTCSKPFQTKVI